jgi:hypothetical protein
MMELSRVELVTQRLLYEGKDKTLVFEKDSNREVINIRMYTYPPDDTDMSFDLAFDDMTELVIWINKVAG